MTVLSIAFVATTLQAATYNIVDGDVAGLIAAINSSNANPGPDVINLATGGTYTLTYVAGPDGWHGDTGLPIVQGPSQAQPETLTINGNGSTIQRSQSPGTPDFRIFHALYANVTIDSLIIKGGRGQGSRCGGGGLYLNVSNTVIRNSTITENFGIEGGGICNNNASTLSVENSTISHNTAIGGRTGGGILNFAATQLSISNSTIYENQAGGSPGFEGRGDSIADDYSPPGSISIKNSILASPNRGIGNECIWFTPVSGGHNIFGDSTCGQNVAGGDLIVPALQLDALTNNGGSTPTHALPPGSPAIDAIPSADCTTIGGQTVSTDQRGIARPFGSGCDIGSYEFDVPSDTTPPVISPMLAGTLGNAGWYKSDVGVSWSVTDSESAVSSSSGCDAASVTSDTSSVTFTCTATSGGGADTQSVTIKRDATAPTIAVTSPTSGNYMLNQAVTVGYSCGDGGSSVANCTGTTANGGSLDTATLGAKAFTVSSSDIAGNAAVPIVVNYTVNFGVIALYDQTKAHKSGSTVPVKVRLVDANGGNVSSASTIVHAVSVIQTSSQASTNLDDAGSANPDFDFRYDTGIGGYIFNLKTTGYGTGSYLLNFVVGNSPTTYSVGFQVRQ